MVGNFVPSSTSAFWSCVLPHISSCLLSSSGIRSRFRELAASLLTFFSSRFLKITQVIIFRSDILWYWLDTWITKKLWPSSCGSNLSACSEIRWFFLKLQELTVFLRWHLSSIYQPNSTLHQEWALSPTVALFCCWVFPQWYLFWHRELLHQDPNLQVISIWPCFLGLIVVWRGRFIEFEHLWFDVEAIRPSLRILELR